MSDVANPSNSPSSAAQQIIVELIRAGKISHFDAEATAKDLTSLYERLVDGFKAVNDR